MPGAFLATLLFAVSAVSAGRTARLLGGVTANFIRMCMATALLAAWAHGLGGGLGGGAFSWFLLSGCIGFGIGDLALYQALPRLGPRLSILLVHCLAAPFAALLEWTWLGTQLGWVPTAAAALTLAGVALALSPGAHALPDRASASAGMAWGVLAAAGQGAGAVVSRKAYALVAANGMHVDGGTAAYQRILGGLVISLMSMWWLRATAAAATDPRAAPPADRAFNDRLREAMPWLALNCVAGPSLGVACYQWALNTAPSGIVLPIVATTPLAVMPLSYWIDGDRPTRRSLAGGLIAVLGAGLLAWSRSR